MRLSLVSSTTPYRPLVERRTTRDGCAKAFETGCSVVRLKLPPFPPGTNFDARLVSTDDDSAHDDARKEDEKSSVGETEKPSVNRAADANQVRHLSSVFVALPN